MEVAKYLLIMSAGLAGAVCQSLIKQWAVVNGHRSLAGKFFNGYSLAIAVVSLTELLLIRQLYRRGLQLIDVVIFQEMAFLMSVIIIGVAVHNERLSPVRAIGIGTAIVSIILMSAGSTKS